MLVCSNKVLSEVNAVDKRSEGSYRTAKKHFNFWVSWELSPYWAGCSQGDCVGWGSKGNTRSNLINNCPLKRLIWDQSRTFLKSWIISQYYFFCSLAILTRTVPLNCLWNKVLCYLPSYLQTAAGISPGFTQHLAASSGRTIVKHTDLSASPGLVESSPAQPSVCSIQNTITLPEVAVWKLCSISHEMEPCALCVSELALFSKKSYFTVPVPHYRVITERGELEILLCLVIWTLSGQYKFSFFLSLGKTEKGLIFHILYHACNSSQSMTITSE